MKIKIIGSGGCVSTPKPWGTFYCMFYSHWLQLVQPEEYFGYKKCSQQHKSINSSAYQEMLWLQRV